MKKRKRGKIFLIALAALLFAEAGYILGTTGLGWMIFSPKPAGAAFGEVLAVSEGIVFHGGNVTVGRPPLFDNAYVYVINYAPGQRLPERVVTRVVVDAGERPVYILPLFQGYVLPDDFLYDIPKNLANPVVVLYPAGDKWATAVTNWLHDVGSKLRVDLVPPARVTLDGGNAVAWVKV